MKADLSQSIGDRSQELSPTSGSVTSGHTPGPWKACPSIEGDFLGVYPDTGRCEFPVAKMPEFIQPELNASNARLIAAAPELLEALKALMPAGKLIGESYDPPVPEGELLKEFLFTWGKLRAARAAISKAEGK